MNLCTLAYPTLATSDYEKIQAFRKQHDRYYRIVEPHFTLVFPYSAWEVAPYIAEITKQVQGIRPFNFCIRCAALSKDAFQDSYHAFLIPDEGYSNLAKLHDILYADVLFPYRILDVDYIPHLGVGNSIDALSCVEMVEYWNREEFSITGHIAALNIANYENDTVQTIARIPLVG